MRFTKLNMFFDFSISHTFIFDVPYKEKDLAKQKGLRWSLDIKRWYKIIKSNGDYNEVIDALGDTFFKIIDIQSNMFEVDTEQKQKLFDYYLYNFENKEQRLQKEREVNEKREKLFDKKLERRMKKQEQEKEKELDKLEESFNNI
jgi:hypothetical protein